jgi:hypothetical protein
MTIVNGMSEKVSNFLKSLNPESLSKLAEFIPSSSGSAAAIPSAIPSVIPSVIPSASVAKAIPELTNYYDSGFLITVGGIMTIVIIIWYIIKISIKFTINDEKVNKNFEYIDSFLFGDSGFFPMIFSIWVVILAGAGIFDGLNYLIDSTNSFTPTIQTLPAIAERIIAIIKSIRSLYR